MNDFGWAIKTIKLGYYVARKGWNGRDMYIMYVPEDPSTKQLPYIGMKTASGSFVPWLASQTDMLMDDWYKLEG
jgi:hypothetical protein